MPLIHYILKDGSTRTVQAKAGQTVMETAIRANVRGIDAECGGSCACATCHVYVEEAFFERLPPADDMEAEMLDEVAVDREDNSRLSCQIVVTDDLDGLTVRVPQRQA
ncbi:2Fe-2S iron-sulfur cluster binding domain-containing protein [Verticiella sediminum]|uniref:2Fe-2S iron-sulfur cluster binding domain-containing protein n=1 Tax=Verticiella sediminum TaxID=1247510 RepID=A0A556AFU5_9BURK|nr:2Fe-2S iron-sulfur cluster-binding protein [Verticiella sediminum]TSH91768.1 2Fe-2S iron-sulfur cluster binding domain-containing protein [Verticiella sediminum]